MGEEPMTRSWRVFRDAALVAAKDLRIEARSRVTTNQVIPVAVLVLVLFAFALDPDRGVLARAAPGLYWVAALLAALLAVQRAAALESHDGAIDGLRLSGLDAGGIFLGKAFAVTLELIVLEAVLAVGVVVLYGVHLGAPLLLVAAALAGAAGLALAGTLYAAVAVGLSVRETLLPLLMLPVVAPVLLAGTRAWEAGLAGSTSEGWSWLVLLVAFASVYGAAGVLTYGALIEEAT